MNRMRLKKMGGFCLVIGMILSVVGCGSAPSSKDSQKKVTQNTDSETNKDVNQKTNVYKKDAIKIEDIDWNVAEGVIDGERFVSFNYVNNSAYTIIDIELEFKQKEGTTAEQLSLFNELKADNEWTDEEIQEIYILGYNRKCADSGEQVSDSPCVINGTYTLVENMAQYEIMEPDMMTIGYIGDDGKGYVEYYDFGSLSYGSSSQGAQDLQLWSTTEISGLLPKEKFRAVSVDTDEKDSFSFSAYGVSREEYQEYVNSVKEKGFITEEFEGSDSYSASNAEGFVVDISYIAVEETMIGDIEKEN